jgi:hypothetical protein
MKMWKGNWNTAILLFSLKGLEILHQERRGHVNTMWTTSAAFSSTNTDLLTSSISINQSAVPSLYQNPD